MDCTAQTREGLFVAEETLAIDCIWWKISHRILLIGLFLLLITGCNETSQPAGEVIDESWFSLQEEEPASPTAPPATGEAKTTLGFQLKPGDKFPLQKVVEKTLTQSTLQGPVESMERIELAMSVTVEEVRDQNKKFRILYSRVQVDSNLNGQQIHYDSQQPPARIPDQVLAYHGMVNNGFSFWVGPDNKITDVVDFNQFLQRCLQNIPEQKAEMVSQMLAQSSGQEGIANFVDDTIGLLPYDPHSQDGSSVVRLGGNWTKSRHFNDPVPMSLKNTYTLQEVNEDYAKIDVLGEIVPAAAVSNPEQAVALQIRGGQAAGTCTIDRKTGLPLSSQMDYQLSMAVQMNNMQFDQNKRVVTSIRMFPQQKVNTTEQLAADPATTTGGLSLQPASHRLKLE